MSAIVIFETDGTVTYAVGAGDPGPLAIDFPYFFADEIVVSKIVQSAGTEELLVVTVDYVLTGVAADDGFSSGSIALAAHVRSCHVRIDRTLRTSKATNFPAMGAISIPAMNTLFSRLFSLIQDIRRELDLNADHDLSAPDWDTAINELPPASQRAGMILGFDGSGQPILIPPSSLSPIVPSRTISAATYTLAASDNGYTLRFTSAAPVTVTFPGILFADFQCILFQAKEGTVTCVEDGSQIENGYDATGSEQRSIDGKGFGLHVWCDENPTGSAAHFWIQGVTKS